MGYTRYWKCSENKYDQEIIDTINNIIKIADEDFGIALRSGDGTGSPIVNLECISINGDGYNDLDYESFVIINGEADGFNFCKTARKPYDIAINAILQYLDDEGIVYNITSDGPNMEKHASELLKKATKTNDRRYTLEAYDKDNDVYYRLLFTDSIENARELGTELTKHDWNMFMPSGEPIDWLIITDTKTNTNIEYFDTYDKKWHPYTYTAEYDGKE